MIDRVRKFFETRVHAAISGGKPADAQHSRRLATAALLVEISRADDEITEVERAAILRSVQRAFNLNSHDTQELVKLAEREVEESVSLYQFTKLVDNGFNRQQKKEIVELMWKVSFADGELDKYEEHLVRKIADLLHVSHGDYIHAKHKAMHGKA
jgi:uncharacterized tellurite resistance protein B-like protein